MTDINEIKFKNGRYSFMNFDGLHQVLFPHTQLRYKEQVRLTSIFDYGFSIII
jgi:hypothetical protein